MIKIAGVQFDVQLGDVAGNVDRMQQFLRETAEQSAVLTVFPECAVAGYCFGSADEARGFAESVPGPSTEKLQQTLAETNSYAVVGMLEAVDDRLYNAAVLIGPDGVISSYRKAHLPYLGVDRFTSHGDRPFAVDDAGGIRVGMNICYDASFPEVARTLTLLGADLIALPTNWPPGAECAAEVLIRTRAMENGVYFMAVNRVGVERDFVFIGRSQVADPSGRQLYLASADQEEVFYVEIDPDKARRKHVVRVSGEHEIDRLADRRPDLYDRLTDPKFCKTPGYSTADAWQARRSNG